MKIQLFSLVLAAALLNTAIAVPMMRSRGEVLNSLERAFQQQQQQAIRQQQRQPAFVTLSPQQQMALREARDRQRAQEILEARERAARERDAAIKAYNHEMSRRTNADINAGLADRQGRPQQGHGGPSSYRGNGDATVSMFKPHGTKQKQKSMITTRRVLTGTGIAAGIAAAAYPKKTMDYLDRFAKFTGLKEDKPTPKKVTVTPAKPAAAAAPAKPVAANTTAAAAPTNGTATAVPAAKTETVTVSLKPAPAASAAPVTASKPEEKKEEDKKAN